MRVNAEGVSVLMIPAQCKEETAGVQKKGGPDSDGDDVRTERAIDIFVDECEGQRRSGGNAARQWLRWHRCDHDRRVNPVAVAMAASVFEPHILQNLCLDLDRSCSVTASPMRCIWPSRPTSRTFSLGASSSMIWCPPILVDTSCLRALRFRRCAEIRAHDES